MPELDRLSVDGFRHSTKVPVVCVLDNIRSMHNVGSVFRTCDAFRVQKLMLCGITACPPHREISRSALGATESVEWEHYEDTKDAIRELSGAGYEIIAIEQTTDSIYLENLTLPEAKPVALVFGNEVQGVSDAVLQLCHRAVEIPQFGTKHSFNVSVTAGIVLYALTLPMHNV